MNQIKTAALWFGIVLTVIGIAGFIPALTTEASDGHELLLGVFETDALHNVIHLASGVVAMLAASSASTSRLFFQIFAGVYGLVTVVGILQGDTVLGLIPVNLADNLLHILITIFAAYYGFAQNAENTKES